MSERDEIRLVLRPLPDAVPWPHRLRRLLKYALRSCGLRCLRVEQLPAAPGSPQDRAGRVDGSEGTSGPPAAADSS